MDDQTEYGALHDLYLALRAEVDEIAGGQRHSGDPDLMWYPDPIQLDSVKRRALVRSVFSFIEGTVYGLKQFATGERGARFSVAELALVNEESYELKDNGEVITRAARIRFLSNVRFAFNIFAKAAQVQFVLSTASLGCTN